MSELISENRNEDKSNDLTPMEPKVPRMSSHGVGRSP